MPSIADLPCWEIMNCSDTESCPAKTELDRSCWDIVRDLADYRAEFDICPDCIVYVVKNTDIDLSSQEIIKARENCGDGCPLNKEGS